MSEQTDLLNEAVPNATTTSQQTLGQWLVAQRQARGMSAQDVAIRTNRNIQQIMTIEADDFSKVNAPALLRAVVRHYAKAIGINENDALMHLPVEFQKNEPTLTARDPQISQVFTHSGTPIKTPWVSRTVLVILALAVIGLIAYWTVGARIIRTNEATSKALTPNQVEVVAPAPVASVTEAPAVTAMATTGDDLLLKFKGDSWVEIKDADGKVLLSGAQVAGSEQTVAGKLPFKVKVGNATNVEAIWKNAPYDLAPFIKGGVARLTLE